jgi:hypothetical protein
LLPGGAFLLIGLAITLAYIGGTIVVRWFDHRKIESAVLEAGGEVESITLYAGHERFESWRDLNKFGPRCYKVRRVDADGVTRTNEVIVELFSDVKWGDSVR